MTYEERAIELMHTADREPERHHAWFTLALGAVWALLAIATAINGLQEVER